MAEKQQRGIVRTDPYLVLSAPDGSRSVVVHQMTGRTVAEFEGDDNRAQADRDAKNRNRPGGERSE